eukprot:TRINITY_DN17267_c0_g1_i1.p1 TRINITY_DN17267_c0_g1~~TRINITY_DN17267_c0_g1_i1.p1  ORF type:complete len:440 (-),score=76.98 TRINITY_DN17267_c0_g1_i1:7-1326(-)
MTSRHERLARLSLPHSPFADQLSQLVEAMELGPVQSNVIQDLLPHLGNLPRKTRIQALSLLFPELPSLSMLSDLEASLYYFGIISILAGSVLDIYPLDDEVDGEELEELVELFTRTLHQSMLIFLHLIEERDDLSRTMEKIIETNPPTNLDPVVHPIRKVTVEYTDPSTGITKTHQAEASFKSEFSSISRTYGMFTPACQAFFASSVRARRVLHKSDIETLIDHIRWVSATAKMQHQLLSVLDDEELVVMSMIDRKGFVVRIGGISDNEQLQILLAHTLLAEGLQLPVDLSYPVIPPPKNLVRVFTGETENQSSEVWFGIWNLENWTSIFFNEGQEATAAYKSHWVWGEGVPNDIAKFRGRRTVFLRTAPYQRSIAGPRIFGPLKASVKIEKMLSTREFDELLDAMKSVDLLEKTEVFKFVKIKAGGGATLDDNNEDEL